MPVPMNFSSGRLKSRLPPLKVRDLRLELEQNNYL
jgi:hypothetical protein